MEKRRRNYLRGAVSLLLLILIGGYSFPLLSQERGNEKIQKTSCGDDGLFVSLSVNAVPAQELVQLFVHEGQLCMRTEDLRATGIDIPDSSEKIMLSTLSGVNVNWDMPAMRLDLTVPVGLLRHQKIISGGVPYEKNETSPSVRSLGLNYTMQGTNFQTNPSFSSWSEFRLQLSDNTALSSSQRTLLTHSGYENVRMDTVLQQDYPSRDLSVMVGDFSSGTTGWGRSVYMGGIRFSRNYDLNPYELTVPMSSFAGETVLPSTVDLYINGIRQASQSVSPGPFDIEAPALQRGAGEATMVVTDITGQKRQYNFDIYGAPEMLRKGIAEGSFESGYVRLRPGESSNDYDSNPVMTGSLRYGATDWATFDSHTEHSNNVSLFGAGIGWNALFPGVITLHAIQSRDSEEGQGSGWIGSYHWSKRPFTVSLQKESYTRAYRDIASEYGGASNAETWQVFFGVTTPIGEFSLGNVYQEDITGEVSRYKSLSWSKQWGRMGTLSLSVSTQKGNDSRDQSLNLAWSLPLAQRRSASFNAQKSASNTRFMSGVTQSPERGSSVTQQTGWHLMTSADRSDSSSYQIDATTLSSYGDFAAGAFRSQGQTNSSTTWASANGSVLMLPEGVFFSSLANDSYALVSTAPASDVPVKLENRPAGQTDRNGYALITGLNAWQHNLISVDPLSLPASFTLDKISQDVIPSTRSGVRVNFPVNTQMTIQLVLHDEEGHELPINTPVWLEKSTNEPNPSTPLTRTGYGGFIYIESPSVTRPVLIAGNGKARCTVKLTEDLINAATTPKSTICIRS